MDELGEKKFLQKISMKIMRFRLEWKKAQLGYNVRLDWGNVRSRTLK